MIGGGAHRCARRGETRCIDRDDARRERRYTEKRRPHPRAGDRSVMNGIRRGRQVVCALRNRADLAIDLPAANRRRLSAGDFAVAMSGLRFFATSFAWGSEIVRDAEPGVDRRDCRWVQAE
jgi:RNase adaptor protein for sRNA GlmZ degradation